MRRRVVIIGGGIAGLSAAHELIERGFDVEVYERRPRWGGKAASGTSPHGFPSEHGFRFFPGWYQHLPDTMKRIPYKGSTVYDNLVKADMNLLASYRDEVRALLRLPVTFAELGAVTSFPPDLLRLGLTPADLVFFFGKLAQFALASESERVERYEGITWWDFMEVPSRPSKAFRDYLVDGVTRNTVAANPRQASAYTIASLALRTLGDTLRLDTMIDRVLNGPTSEVFIDPWVDYLKAQGVTFVDDAELESIQFAEDAELRSKKVAGPRISCIKVLRRSSERREAVARLDAMQTLLRLHVEMGRRGLLAPPHAPPPDLAPLVQAWAQQRLAGHAGAAEHLAREYLDAAESGLLSGDLKAQCGELAIEALLRFDREALEQEIAQARAETGATLGAIESESARRIEADYFVFALPVEQMAYYVHRSPMMRRYDPDLRNVVRLSEHVAWMAGIQFYLTEDVKITRGHIDCLDSEWHLTAISQTQFWPDVDMKERGSGAHLGKVKSILSVDISAWDKKGQLHRKEAFACSPQEIAEEVWHELALSLNRTYRAPVLRDDMLLGGELSPASYCLDENIADRFDRKRQAFYKKFESVRFSSETIAERQRQTGDEALETSFAYGDRVAILAEPLLVNRAGTLALRPPAGTKISNMLLAADYVATHTNLASMEGANEAARHAVNEILARSGSTQRRCRIWTFDQLSQAPKRFASEALAAMSAAVRGADRWFDRFNKRKDA